MFQFCLLLRRNKRKTHPTLKNENQLREKKGTEWDKQGVEEGCICLYKWSLVYTWIYNEAFPNSTRSERNKSLKSWFPFVYTILFLNGTSLECRFNIHVHFLCEPPISQRLWNLKHIDSDSIFTSIKIMIFGSYQDKKKENPTLHFFSTSYMKRSEPFQEPSPIVSALRHNFSCYPDMKMWLHLPELLSIDFRFISESLI